VHGRRLAERFPREKGWRPVTRCAKCHEAFVPPNTIGRPPRYCSAGCRRATEYELRRLQGHLEVAERNEARYRSGQVSASARHAAEQAEIHASEIRRLEARMRELLDDPQEDE
jgi:hypothetical protein